MDELSILPLRTPRLTLRALLPVDAAIQVAYRNDPEVYRYQDWEVPVTLEAAESFVAEQAGITGPRPAAWVQIGIEQDGELAGDVAMGLDGTGKLATIGYTLRADQQGRGFATEAVGSLLDAMFERGLHRAAATLDPDNIASAMLLERLGFRYEGRAVKAAFVRGEWLDDDRYAMLRDERAEWLARPRTPAVDVGLIEVTEDNQRAVSRLVTHHSQERFVAPMAATFADALIPQFEDGMRIVPWFRAIEADGELVGFMMIAEHTPPGDIPFLWRLLIDRRHQGRGIGSRAVGLLIDRLRAAGEPRLHASWHPGRGGPEPFYRKLGFVPTGRVEDNELVAELLLG
ncbi:MAG: GNAT family N-acetyltransferase [Chloroflexi bacterium]|nr:GNAT family N-acetyltransferase [Chloroflexota bacterium]